MPLNPKALHDQDWIETKASEAFFEQAPRYLDLATLIAALGPRILLDVGCGSGYLAKLLKERLPHLIVHGVDCSLVALKRARGAADWVWQVDLDKADLPIYPDQYDAVSCVEVLEHLYDPLHVLREIVRVLKPGGYAVVTVPNLAYWRYRLALLRGRVPLPAADPRHLRQFDQHRLAELLAQAGLQLTRLTGHGLRLALLARRRPDVFSDILIAICRKVG
jgi:2-polyprenyl-3-methyl-5-hydroxy-6-metoxy-1,4-benzoquinol methylase